MNCKIYTPDNWVNILLDEVGYKTDLYGKRVLENSCGTGNILRRIVERYIVDAIANGYAKSKIKEGLEKDIVGLEIDKVACKKCKARLSYMAKKYGITGVRWNIIQDDALIHNLKDYMYVIGNPPYITYHDLDLGKRTFLRSNFQTCKKGRFDYCYAFIEQSINNLMDCGQLAYILPNSILKNVWAEDLRKYIKPYLRKIIDLKNRNVFEDVTLSPIILIAKKEKKNLVYKVQYQCEDENIDIKLDEDDFLASSWALGNYNISSKQKFGDYFGVANSVATLYNQAFIIKEYKILDDDYIKTDQYLIERDILKEAISIKSINAKQCPLIIFPYRYNHDFTLMRYNEDDLQREYPYAMKYLEKYKKNLNERTSDKSAKWFEYGRSQALRHLNCEKLVISSIVSKKIKVEYAGVEQVPYAGLYITQKGTLPLDRAKKILENEDFWCYVKQFGVPTAENSYRISKKIIEGYSFDL